MNDVASYGSYLARALCCFIPQLYYLAASCDIEMKLKNYRITCCGLLQLSLAYVYMVGTPVISTPPQAIWLLPQTRDVMITPHALVTFGTCSVTS